MKFETKTIPNSLKLTGLFACNNCVYHKVGYNIPSFPFSFKLINRKGISPTYKNYFACDSKGVIYILICKTWDNYYLWQTQDFQQRIAKHNQMSRACITELLETAKKPNHISKYFHSIMKQILHLENIKKNDTSLNENLN